MEKLKNKLKPLVPAHVRRLLRKLMNFGLRFKRSLEKKVPSTLAVEEFGGFALAYRKHTADDSVIEHSFENDIFLPGIPEYIPKQDDVVIDVGAHIGTLSMLLSKRIPNGRIYAIEASRESYNLLKINIALNGISNISEFHLALSGENGTCTLYHSKGNWGHSMTKRLSKSSEIVEAKTLDSFFEQNKILKCDLLKLNCEGAEFPILLNASSETLDKINFILALYHCDLWNKNSEEDLANHLRSNGFKCELRRRAGRRGWIVAHRS